eukprot:1771434-Alexandrium_andersonii.AAC.1
MSASLVGSEMCIRDRVSVVSQLMSASEADAEAGACAAGGRKADGAAAVSYTHLTLPTICSV